MLCLCPRLGCVGGWTKDNTDAAAWLTRRSCNGLSKAGPLEHGGGGEVCHTCRIYSIQSTSSFAYGHAMTHMVQWYAR